MKSNLSVSSNASLTDFCSKILVVFIFLKTLELRSYHRKFEIYIYLGSTLNPRKKSYLLYSLTPKINIKSLQPLLKLFLEIGNERRRSWFPRNFNFC